MRWTRSLARRYASESRTCSRKFSVDTRHETGINASRSGIGGGGFMTVRIPPATPNASSEVFTIDFRETAPALSNRTMYVDNPLASRWGGLAVGVPGELRGLEEAHRRWGLLQWKTLVKPAADLAKGWPVPTELARRLQVSSLHLCTYFVDPRANLTFCGADVFSAYAQ